MRGKNKMVFSPHHISARNNKVSLIPNISIEVVIKIAVRSLQIVGRKKVSLFPTISVKGKQKLSFIHFISFQRTTEFLISIIIKFHLQ